MSADLTGVLAHELTHARQPVGRPRFLLRVRSGAMDADERAAHAVGQQVAAAPVAGDTHGGSAPVVQRSISAPASLGSLATRSAVPPPGSVTSGLVDQLPVGGASGNAVSEARSVGGDFASGLRSMSKAGGTSGASGADATARGLLAALAAADPNAAAEFAGSGGGHGMADAFGGHGDFGGHDHSIGHSIGHGAGHGTGFGDGAGGYDAESASQAALSSTAASAAAAHTAAGHATTPHRLPDTDIDRIVEAVEQRLLRQLERRGGRYAGVF